MKTGLRLEVIKLSRLQSADAIARKSQREHTKPTARSPQDQEETRSSRNEIKKEERWGAADFAPPLGTTSGDPVQPPQVHTRQ